MVTIYRPEAKENRLHIWERIVIVQHGGRTIADICDSRAVQKTVTRLEQDFAKTDRYGR